MIKYREITDFTCHRYDIDISKKTISNANTIHTGDIDISDITIFSIY